MPIKNCPCGRNKTYSDCCKKAHENILSVKTPEDLMRSRYSAFVLSNVDYLIKSWSPNTCDSSLQAKKEIKQWSKSVNWLKLEILNSSLLSEKDLTGTVEFKAFYIENGKTQFIHENSLFEKTNRHWVYVDKV